VGIDKYLLSQADYSSTKVLDVLVNAYSYSLFFFFDFAGYSAIAIGVGLMMGISLPLNFNMPLLATNPVEFWRRFHITLGSWLSDFIFKPGYKYLLKFSFFKRHRLVAQNISLFLTFSLMGLWNGPQQKFILSGCIFGIYSIIHNTYKYYSIKKRRDIFNILPIGISVNLKRFLMAHAAAFALYIFSGKFPIL
jgi:membrane protein involved in D-alanine export